jgi:hypothetical protein
MDTKLLKQFIANKSPKKQLIAESTVPKAVLAYLNTPYSQHTYGTAYDAGSEVAGHPAVKAYHAQVHKELGSLPSSRANNDNYVRAYHTIPKDVLNKVAKDFGTTADKIAGMYGSYARD